MVALILAAVVAFSVAERKDKATASVAFVVAYIIFHALFQCLTY